MAAKESVPRLHAVLIGLNCYPDQTGWNQLKGCVKDVQGISSLLAASLPRQASVHMLTSSRGCSDSAGSQPSEDQEHLATWDNVHACLKRVASEVHSGDSVYIHYSGHGTIKPPSNQDFSNYTTGDHILVLLHGTDSLQTRYLYADELSQHLQAMVRKGAIVSLVVDACFSGSTLRDEGTVRYLEFDPKVFDTYPPTIPPSHAATAHATSTADQPVGSTGRDASMRSNWLLDPSKFLVFTACGPGEKAREATFDGEKRGVLSFYLQEQFNKLKDRLLDAGSSIESIYQAVSARVRNSTANTEYTQNPMLYGGTGEGPFLFGGSPPADDAPPGSPCSCCSSGVIAVVRTESVGADADAGEVLELQAGEAHGIRRDDLFELRASVSPTFGCGRGSTTVQASSVVEATVVDVGPLTSRLCVPGGSRMAARVRTGWLAIARTRLLLRELPVGVCPSVRGAWTRGTADVGDNEEEWQTAMREFNSLDVRLEGANSDNSDNSDNSSIRLVSNNGLTVKIVDGSDPGLVYWESDAAGDRCLPMDLLRLAQHLAWLKFVWRLTNQSLANDDNHLFRGVFDLYMQPDGQDRRIYPGCQRNSNSHMVCTHPECVIHTRHEDSFRLVAENREPEEGLRVFAHVFDIGSRWQVENALAANHEEIHPRGTNKKVGAYFEGCWTKNLTFRVPEDLRRKGKTECEDIIKVFLTAMPTSFASLALPKLGDRLQHTQPHESVDRGQGYEGGSTAEYWAAFNFRVRTHVQT